MKLQKDFYLRSDVVEIARDLIGKVIYTHINNQLTAGIIIETEAYAGVHDKASHAYNNRRTNRTEIMYRAGGISYVYLCYGVHYLFNFVTNQKEIPHAVLLRGITPFNGLDVMKNRTGKNFTGKGLVDGPGKVTKALGLSIKHNGMDLTGNIVWVTNEGININEASIMVSPRIGVQYAGEDAKLPFRFLYTGGLL